MNLLPQKLTDEEIKKCVKELPDFKLNIIEGGYVSPDNSVILIDNRRPYIGMLLQFKREVKQETLEYWTDKIQEILKAE